MLVSTAVYKKVLLVSAGVALAGVVLGLPADSQAELPRFQTPYSAPISFSVLEEVVSPQSILECRQKADQLQLATLGLRNLDGSLVSGEAYGEKKVVLYFWSIYCRSCVETMAELEAMRQALAEKDTALLTVHLFESNVARVKAVVEKFGINLPVVMAGNQVRDLYAIRSVPTSLVFDNKRQLIARFDGAEDAEGVREMILGSKALAQAGKPSTIASDPLSPGPVLR